MGMIFKANAIHFIGVFSSPQSLVLDTFKPPGLMFGLVAVWPYLKVVASGLLTAFRPQLPGEPICDHPFYKVVRNGLAEREANGTP